VRDPSALLEPAAPGSGEDRPRRASPLRLLVRWLIRHRKPVLLAALAAFVAGTVFTVKLYSNLRSGFEELLPDNAPSVVAARTLGPKLHAVTHLSIVFEGQDADALERLADDVAARVKRLPPDLVESVEYRTDEQEAFARRFGGLYLAVEDLDAIQSRIDARVAWEKKRANPMLNLLGDEEELGPAPALDFGDIERKYGAVTGALAQFRKGYFQTPDGKLLVLLVRPPESATGIDANKRVLDAVRREVEAAQPRRYDPTVRVGYNGEVTTLVEEQAALAADLLASTVVVLVLVLLALYVYFRRFTALFSILGSLAVGCAVSFGLSYFLIGYLNANTAFLGSIVLGNGINVPIILVARFLEERRRGRPLEEAIELSWVETLAPTFVAAFSAGLAYLSLALTDFRGFSQFGLIGGLGMALCWITSYLLLPPLLATLDPRSKRPPAPGRRSIVGAVVTRLHVRHARALQVGALLLLAAAGLGVATYRGELIEYDLSRLRAAKSAESGAQYWGNKVDQVFRAYLTPVVIRAETPEDLERFAAELDRARAALGPDDPLREVRTLQTTVPAEQQPRLARLERLRASLTDARLAALEPALREKVRLYRPPADLRRVTLDDLPVSLKLPLVERDGTAGRVALAFPRKVGWLSRREMNELGALVRGAIERSGARAQAVGQALLLADITDAIGRDGPAATLAAFLAVVLLVALALRRLRPTVEVVGSLLLGVAWLVGVAAWSRVRLNFLNFVVFPITFGIGVDYAVNIVQRWRQEGHGAMERVLRETGGAVALCSLTTIIGYGSLLVADNRALRGFGMLASVGEVACLAAALLALPAFLVRRGEP
jgi:predicted RND superfamily exporter protein